MAAREEGKKDYRITIPDTGKDGFLHHDVPLGVHQSMCFILGNIDINKLNRRNGPDFIPSTNKRGKFY